MVVSLQGLAMGCKVSKQGPASEKSIEQKAAALGGTAAADTGAVCPVSHYEATSDATSVASQYGSSAHTSQAGGGKCSTEGLTTLACPVTGATTALASSNNTDTDSAAAAAGSELPCTAGQDGEAPKLASEHKYNSFERPARSSLRTSMEQRRTSEPGSGGRRAVGFSIDENEAVCPLNSRDSGKHQTLLLMQAHSIFQPGCFMTAGVVTNPLAHVWN